MNPTALLHRLVGLAAAALVLAGCANSPALPTYAEITFTDKPPLKLAVAGVEIVDEYMPPGRAPNVDHLFPVRPAATAARWARDRLRAVGGDMQLRYVVKDAAVTETRLETSKGLVGYLKDQQGKRYDAVLQVRIEFRQNGAERGYVMARARRSRTVPESITLNARDAAFHDMLRGLALEIDATLEKNIRKTFGDYLR